MAKDRRKQLPQLPDFDFEAFQKEALKQLKAGKPITGKDGVLTPLIKRIVESALKGGLDAHLEAEADEDKNRKNGKTSKTVRSDYGVSSLRLLVTETAPLSRSWSRSVRRPSANPSTTRL